MTFYVTFGQDHPLKDYWMEIKAATYDVARSIAMSALGTKFAFLYSEDKFDKAYFPGGKVGKTME